MMKPYSILFVDHAEALGGGERCLLLLLQHLDRTRFRPILACNPGPLAEAARALQVELCLVAMPQLRGRPAALGQFGRTSAALARYIRQEQIDLVHSNVMRASFYAALAARLAGRPLIWHVRDIHAAGQPGGTWYPRLMCSLSDRVIAMTEAIAAALPCAERIRVIYDGLNLADFDPQLDGAAVRAELGLPQDTAVVGILGRVQPWKGQEHFLRAAVQVIQKHPDVHFVVIGDTIFRSKRAYLQELKQLAADLGIADRVTFTGYRSDVERMLAALDIMVHCSKAEPFGMVLIEAMAMARPVAAYADGGVPESVRHGETGLLVDPGDIAALAAAIGDLVEHPDRARAMGQAGRQRVEQCFDARQTAREVEALYSELLTRR